ncbi:MAG TPA: Eco57I restriction-modification methylase domain-containing protein, partial [Alphaproteobacteria bacterium]|nr:Eco57I restriction-modification methylase domain-containing protein [Alphaproteobacteria bacterium]
VFILGKLDPQNEKWKEHQRQRAIRETTEVFKIGDKLERQHRLDDINEVFEQNASDYGRKLYLIENCIYGVDIQPIAVQIAKMRFFISLVADQKVVNDAPNRGVRPLPNLETKFVAANTLIGISRPGQQVLRDREIETKEAELRSVRQRHFVARSLATKRKFRELDARLRGEIANLLKDDGWDPGTARDLAAWDPYDQSTSAPFFDPEWMFGIADGFDVIVANPPYIDSENMTITNPTLRGLIQSSYSMTRGNWDIYIAFYEKAFGLLDNHGVIAFITPDKWISKPFGDEMRLRTNDRIFSILRAGRDVFESSNVDAIVTLHTNSTCSDLRIYDVMDAEIALRRVIVKDALDAPYRYDWLFSDSFDLLAKIETQLTVLSQMATCENACATSDAYKLQEFIQEESRDTDNTEYLKIINTGTIGKFVSKWGQREMVYLRHRYLRPVVDRSRFLRAFPNSYGKKSIKPKLIVKGLNLLDICLDAEGNNIPGKTTLIVTADDLTTLKLLLGVLNSKLTFFYLREKYPASSYNEGTTFTKQMLNDLPLPQFADAASRKVISFVEQIVAAKTENPVADTTALEREINSLVYGSYGLTPEEIKIVEEVTGA